jgi:ABC-2 type transport system permease protein
VDRALTVARREYLERVRSRAFLIGTFVGPVLMAALMIGPALIAQRQRGKPQRIAVVDETGALGGLVERALGERREGGEQRFLVEPGAPGPSEEARVRLKQRVLAGTLDGILVLPADALQSSQAEYHGRSVGNRLDMRLLDRVVEEVLVGQRLAGAGLDPARVRSLTRPLDLKLIRVSERGDREDRGATFLFATVMMMILYGSVLLWGQALMTGVIEEKSNRVVELVVSSMSPWQLLSGKLLGVGGAGLTQLLVWVLSMALISVFGGPALASGDVPMPEITPLILVSFPVFFLLGYFLYAAIYAAIGAAVNTVQEAQSLVFPAIAPLIASIMFFPVVLQSPDSTLSVALSLFPLATPLLMFLRITALTPPWWQIALGIALTSLTVVLVTWASARIYRIGILMYGKRPTFPELMRWVRRA